MGVKGKCRYVWRLVKLYIIYITITPIIYGGPQGTVLGPLHFFSKDGSLRCLGGPQIQTPSTVRTKLHACGGTVPLERCPQPSLPTKLPNIFHQALIATKLPFPVQTLLSSLPIIHSLVFVVYFKHLFIHSFIVFIPAGSIYCLYIMYPCDFLCRVSLCTLKSTI